MFAGQLLKLCQMPPALENSASRVAPWRETQAPVLPDHVALPFADGVIPRVGGATSGASTGLPTLPPARKVYGTMIPLLDPQELEAAKAGLGAVSTVPLKWEGTLPAQKWQGQWMGNAECQHHASNTCKLHLDPLHWVASPHALWTRWKPPHQGSVPFNIPLELQESSRMEDVGLGGSRDVDPRKLALHARSPLATHQVTPGTIKV